MQEKFKFARIDETTFRVTDVQTNAVCTWTRGDFNASQVWNFDGVKVDEMKNAAVELAQAARRVADEVKEFEQEFDELDAFCDGANVEQILFVDTNEEAQ